MSYEGGVLGCISFLVDVLRPMERMTALRECAVRTPGSDVVVLCFAILNNEMYRAP
jgi:hypothetical protein